MSKNTHKIVDDELYNQDDEVQRRVAERAYFIAENRQFEAGRELDDWLEAETCESLDSSIGFPESGFPS
jgi:hypothetical protein